MQNDDRWHFSHSLGRIAKAGREMSRRCRASVAEMHVWRSIARVRFAIWHCLPNGLRLVSNDESTMGQDGCGDEGRNQRLACGVGKGATTSR